jgi:hypothetical protein
MLSPFVEQGACPVPRRLSRGVFALSVPRHVARPALAPYAGEPHDEKRPYQEIPTVLSAQRDHSARQIDWTLAPTGTVSWRDVGPGWLALMTTSRSGIELVRQRQMMRLAQGNRL